MHVRIGDDDIPIEAFPLARPLRREVFEMEYSDGLRESVVDRESPVGQGLQLDSDLAIR
jgi:hypothetical protein